MMLMSRILPVLILLTAASARAVTPDEAMTFLYRTLSLPDKADYSEDFYRRNVNATFLAKNEMPWGNEVPDREFLHFVLPVRVNNENLDLSREVFYEELKDRVKNLSMKEAILEVNHWCHEKATYRPSDSRTSSPLSTVSQAIGRCGEESTFTVAALRSVGIPARQIYTPRWAHTDDNHAWVEAWADGKWYFLGACEPEAVLNLAWFNAPASRGLLMNTNVAGDYDGPEEVLLKMPLSTRINVTANYAPVDELRVKVVYPDGSPAGGAKVNFCIYNYAEYYPAVTKTADSEGKSSLTTGLGDMLVWATDGEKFGFSKGTALGQQSEPLIVVLDKTDDFQGVSEFNIVPPPSSVPLPAVTPEQRELNERRLAREDSIRNAYTSSFATAESAAKAAVHLGVDAEKLTKILTDARGNHRHILQALETCDPMRRDMAIDLLTVISEKDRRDIPMNVISDHIVNVLGYGVEPDQASCSGVEGFNGMEKDLFNEYVLNPRIEIEMLTPWRGELRSIFSEDELKQFRINPEKLVEWVSCNIEDASAENPQHLRMSPLSVNSERKADPLSRSIFFVALARTAGIPSRIDPVTGSTQYMRLPCLSAGDFSCDSVLCSDPVAVSSGLLGSAANTDWVTVEFEKHSKSDYVATVKDGDEKSPSTTLRLEFTPEGYVVDPKYYSQFSLSRIKDGIPSLLEYPEESTVSSLFSSPATIEPGQYILTTGQRLADGGVLARSEIFIIAPGENVVKDLHIRHDDKSISVIGTLNAENIYYDIAEKADKSLLSTTGRGYYVLALVSPGHEPSAHALNDISAVGKELEEIGAKIMVLFDNEDKAERFDKSLFPSLPSNIVTGVDKGGVSRKEIVESLHLSSGDNTSSDIENDMTAIYPIIVIADTFNRIVWVSTGYSIGTGDRLLTTLRSVKE